MASLDTTVCVTPFVTDGESVLTRESTSLLIAIEGINGIGKSLAAERLLYALRAKGMKCQFIHFPQRETDIGKILHKHLTNEIPLLPRTAQLLFSADRWSARETILQCLKNGIHVLTDRYVASGACYAAASNGTFPCQNMSSELGLPKPDLVFYIDGKPNVKRYYQREFYHDDDYERQVLDNFRLTIDTTFVILNTRQNRNYMTDCMVLAVLKQIEKVSPYISLYV